MLLCTYQVSCQIKLNQPKDSLFAIGFKEVNSNYFKCGLGQLLWCAKSWLLVWKPGDWWWVKTVEVTRTVWLPRNWDGFKYWTYFGV